MKSINKSIVALRKESVDRNNRAVKQLAKDNGSLSARRAWIEISDVGNGILNAAVALRKESVDRNKALGLLGWLRVLSLSARRAWIEMILSMLPVCLNLLSLSARRAWIEILRITLAFPRKVRVALRKESVDRNITRGQLPTPEPPSLSARRAWIEIST